MPETLLSSRGRASSDEPTARIGHQNRKRNDRGFEFSRTGSGERLRDAHPLDRLDLVRIRSPLRRLAVPSEEEMQRAFEISGQVVPRVHLQELRRLISGLLEELASRARLGRLAVLRGPSGERERDAPEPVPILAGQDDLFLFRDRENCGGNPEVHSDPILPGSARQLDLFFRDRRPSLAKGLRRENARLADHPSTVGGGGYTSVVLSGVDGPMICRAVLTTKLLLHATQVRATGCPSGSGRKRIRRRARQRKRPKNRRRRPRLRSRKPRSRNRRRRSRSPKPRPPRGRSRATPKRS